MTTAGPGPTASDARMRQLDSLRALGALGVVLVHTLPSGSLLLADLERNALALFFVLSGFLITGVLLRARERLEAAGGVPRTALLAFYWRRGLRIFPAYYLAVAVLALLDILHFRDTLIWQAGYAINYFTAMTGTWPYPGHFWSLAVEEQFYLVWPFLVLYAPRRRLPWLVSAAIALGPISRLSIFLLTHRRLAAVMPVTSWLDVLGLGAALALARLHPADRRRCDRLAVPVFILGVALLAVPLLLQAAGGPVALAIAVGPLPFALLAVSAIHIVANGVQGPLGRVLDWPVLLYLGTISYGIYVFHALVPMVADAITTALGIRRLVPHSPGWRKTVCVLVATVAAASISWFLYERPLQRLRARFDGTRFRQPAAAPQVPVPAKAV